MHASQQKVNLVLRCTNTIFIWKKKKEKKWSFYDELAKLKTAILEEVSENNYGIFKESLTFSHLQ